MPLLHPGDAFPELTLTVPGGKTVTVPETFAGQFGVVLFYRGAWCPYCNAQLRAFQRASATLADAGVRVVALSVDDEAATAGLIAKHGLLVDHERAPHVDPVNLVEVRQVKVRRRGGAVDPGGMHDDVEMPEAVLDGVEDSRGRLLVGDACRERRAAPRRSCSAISLTVASASSTRPAYATATSNLSAASLAAMTRPMPPVPPVTRAARMRSPAPSPAVMGPHLSTAACRPAVRDSPVLAARSASHIVRSGNHMDAAQARIAR